MPLRQRLSRCALVCRSWAAAAAAVPADVNVQLYSPEKCSQLSTWLEARGQQVVLLRAVGEHPDFRQPILQLRCYKLLRLRSLQLSALGCCFSRVQGGAVTRSPSRAAAVGGDVDSTAACSGAADAVVLLPQLRELRLSHARLSTHHLLQLSALSRLSQLHLVGIQVLDSNTQQPMTDQQRAAAVTQLLQHLTGLSDLKVLCPGGNAYLRGAISAMHRLQRLELSLSSSSGTEPLLAALPVSLTAVVITGTRKPTITADAQLSRLTNLQHLSTQFIYIQPDVLAGLTWLRHLRLSWPYSPEHASTSAPALLAALGRLNQLQHLQLEDCQLAWVQQHQKEGEEGGNCWQCFSALTASTQLTALRVTQWYNDPLPGPAALDNVFPTGRLLPHLAVLHLSRATHVGAGTCVGAEQVARIAASCPALQQLVLRNVTPPGFDTACLDQLPPGVTSVEGLGWQRPAV